MTGLQFAFSGTVASKVGVPELLLYSTLPKGTEKNMNHQNNMRMYQSIKYWIRKKSIIYNKTHTFHCRTTNLFVRMFLAVGSLKCSGVARCLNVTDKKSLIPFTIDCKYKLPVLFTPIQFLDYYTKQLNLPQDKLNEGTTCTAPTTSVLDKNKNTVINT